MKGKLVAISLYILLALIISVTCVYWLIAFIFYDIINYYCGGILKLIFILIMIAGIVLPIIKYRKYQQKWILPAVLCLTVLITPVFCNGILKFIEDDLETYSREKWDENINLRIYMLDDLEWRCLNNGATEEYVKALLGEPDEVVENPYQYKYFVSPGYIDPIIFYVQFEDGQLVDTGKYIS